MKKIYFRKVGTFKGALIIMQAILFNKVISLSRNRSLFNGDVHNWKIAIKNRNITAL